MAVGVYLWVIMQVQENAPLAGHTAFKVGGPAKKIIVVNNAEAVVQAQKDALISEPHWTLGYGTNCLISDKGLPGTVLLARDGPAPKAEGNVVIADATANWDDVVRFAIGRGLWGLELMSGIPGNVGAALVGNIAAYGQKVAGTFAWAEVLDPTSGEVKKLDKSDVAFDYRASSLQTSQNKPIVLRVAFALSDKQTDKLTYVSALRVAGELGLKPGSLDSTRKIILATRSRAGSIYEENDPKLEHTAGSFFKNPLVDVALAKQLASHDESGKTVDELLEQNRIHGDNTFRVSAAHVLLAAGFKRGQRWGPVKLHDRHVLKIQNAGGATAQQIYDVAQEIIETVDKKLSIKLEPEVQFLGEFS
jgi:UDP-N-acetylmuramate dehydrogenase